MIIAIVQDMATNNSPLSNAKPDEFLPYWLSRYGMGPNIPNNRIVHTPSDIIAQHLNGIVDALSLLAHIIWSFLFDNIVIIEGATSPMTIHKQIYTQYVRETTVLPSW